MGGGACRPARAWGNASRGGGPPCPVVRCTLVGQWRPRWICPERGAHPALPGTGGPDWGRRPFVWLRPNFLHG
eukprot:4167265-Alexandrium_andersonii.AAC.1